MDLGREDRDDNPTLTYLGVVILPQWISVARTETTPPAAPLPTAVPAAAMDLGREDRDDERREQWLTPTVQPQWISVARTETTRAEPGR